MPFDNTQKTGLDALIDHLRGVKPEQFSMGDWCGTACCIAGHAATIGLMDRSRLETFGAIAFSEAFGMPIETALKITTPISGPGYNAYTSKPHHAVALLEHYRDTGIVDWARAMAATP